MLKIKNMRDHIRSNERLRVFLIAVLVLLATAVLYLSLGHWLIKEAYYGQSISPLNRIIQGQEAHPLSFYIGIADRYFLFVWLVLFSVFFVLLLFGGFINRALKLIRLLLNRSILQYLKGSDFPILLVVFSIGFVLRFYSLSFGLPHTLARPDENVIIGRSLRFFSLDFNPHIFDYPSFYLYLIFLVFLIAYVISWPLSLAGITESFLLDVEKNQTLFLLNRGLSALLGSFTIILAYVVAKKLFNKEVAILSALLLSLTYLHVRDSHFGVTDIPLTFFIVLAFVFIAEVAIHGEMRDYICAGVLTGMAASIKYNGAVLLVPLWLTSKNIIKDLKQIRPIWTAIGVGKKISWGIVAALIAFLITSPFVLLDFKTFHKDFLWQVNHLRTGHWINLGIGWLYHIRFSLRHGIGIPMLVAAVVGAVVGLIRFRRETVLLLSFTFLYYLLIGQGYTVFVRYIIPLLPFLAMLAAISIWQVSSFLRVKKEKFIRAGVLVCLLILIPSLQGIWAFNKISSRADTRNLATNWIAENIPNGSKFMLIGRSGYALPQLDKNRRNAKYVIHTTTKRNYGSFLDKKAFVELLASDSYSYVVLEDYDLGVYSGSYKDWDDELEGTYFLLKSFKPWQKKSSGTFRPLYDQQDAFFVPYAKFGSIVRPGPAIYIYKISVEQEKLLREAKTTVFGL